MRSEWRSAKVIALAALLVLGMGVAHGATPHPGSAYPNAMGASISAQREFRAALPSIYSYSQTAHYQDRADAGIASGDALADMDSANYAVVCPTTMCSPGSKWVMWDVPFLMKETKRSDDLDFGYEQTVSGFATGISRMLGGSSAIGLAVGYDARKMTGRDDYHMKNKADTFHAALFGGTNIGSLFIDAYAGYSRSWNRMENDWGDPGLIYSPYKANYNDTVLSAGLKLSYVWILPNDVRITPSVGADFSHVRSGSFTETNNDPTVVVWSIDKSKYSSLAVPMMVTVNRTFASSLLAFGGFNSLWTPEVRAGYVPRLGNKRAEVDWTAATGNSGKLRSTKLAGSYGTVGGGLKVKLRNKYIFGIDYDYLFGSKYSNHSLTAMYGVSF